MNIIQLGKLINVSRYQSFSGKVLSSVPAFLIFLSQFFNAFRYTVDYDKNANIIIVDKTL